MMGVPWSDRGRNVSTGNIVVKCPWCGSDDPSMHLSVSLSGKGFYCWRNSSHIGKNYVRLVSALCGVDERRAEELVRSFSFDGLPVEVPAFRDVRRGGFEPADFGLPAVEGLPSGHWALLYLEERGFVRPREAAMVGELYAVDEEPFGRGILFPVRMIGECVNAVVRSLDGASSPRYRSLSARGRTGRFPVCSERTSRCLGFYDFASAGGEILCVVEGPFDALKINAYGDGIMRAVCCFGSNISERQLELIAFLRDKFARHVYIPDMDAAGKAGYGLKGLRSMDFVLYDIGSLGFGDPGEMSEDAVKRLMEEIRGSSA